MAVDEFGLTPKQRIFADVYLKCGNAIQSAREAGYKNPRISAEDNMEKPAVKEYIAIRMNAANNQRIASAEEVLQFLTDVMAGRVKDQFGLDASLQDRLKASQELMKRYAVADQRQTATMARLDSLFLEFKAAVAATPEPPKQAEQASPEGPQEEQQQSVTETAEAPATPA